MNGSMFWLPPRSGNFDLDNQLFAKSLCAGIRPPSPRFLLFRALSISKRLPIWFFFDSLGPLFFSQTSIARIAGLTRPARSRDVTRRPPPHQSGVPGLFAFALLFFCQTFGDDDPFEQQYFFFFSLEAGSNTFNPPPACLSSTLALRFLARLLKRGIAFPLTFFLLRLPDV